MISQTFKQSLADISFAERVLEPESMEETADDYAGMDFTESNTAFVRRMLLMIPRNKTVADFGCGPGDLSIILANMRPDLSIIGVDLSPAMVEIATKRSKKIPNVRWKVGDITKPIFRPGEIDFAFSHTTLHHLHELKPFFVEMRKALHACGGFCIRDLRRPQNAKEAMAWIHEATGDNLTERQYELFFYSLRASLTFEEVSQEIRGLGLGARFKTSLIPVRYWMIHRPAHY